MMTPEELVAEVDALMRQRREKGLAVYGKPLDPADGRDWYTETAEELLDGVQYLFAARATHRDLLAELAAVKVELEVAEAAVASVARELAALRESLGGRP